jgi:para-aminobenzoate synthetase component 1
MVFLDQEETKVKINDFARKGAPFLFVINSTMTKGIVYSPDEASREGIFFNFNGITNRQAKTDDHQEITFELFPAGFKTYEKAFRKVQSHIQRGDTYLLNLTFPTKIRTNLTLQQIYGLSNASYKLLFKDQFVVFSPEIFIRIQDGVITGFPMKGTIDAGIPDAEKIILADKKEFYEHNTIVDLIRNDLALVATGIKVNRFRYIDRLHTNRKDLLQVSSEISGILPVNFISQLGEIIFTLLPAGSVTGAPKGKTVQIIRDTETDDRDFYTGICGYFDGNSLDSAVMIRFIENTKNGMMFRSGGGITALSNVVDEFRELIDKVYVPVV